MPTKRVTKNGLIGFSVLRKEDPRLLTGQGKFSSDYYLEDLYYATVLRSPHAHAKIRSIDATIARQLTGVVAILTGADALADGLDTIPHNPGWIGPPDATLRLPIDFKVFITKNTALPIDTVRYVGEPVALVVADTPETANDAAEMIDIEYIPLQSVVHAPDAMAPEAPQIWAGCAENLALTCEVGDMENTQKAFDLATHVVKLDSWIQRVTGSPLEPRAVIGEFNSHNGQYTLHTSSGAGVVRTQERLAKVLGVPLEKCRTVFGDMGGNFGTRNAFFPEYALIPWAAKRTGKSVKWIATRQECFLSDYQGRDLHSEAELALDENGNFLALRGTNTMNLGAYTVFFWPLRKGLSMMQSVYNIPHVYFKGHAVLTNTAPTSVYRSAGRPEAIYMMERLIDLAANQYNFDRVKIRHRNLIKRGAMPFKNAVGATYDSGNYRAAMDRALLESDWVNFKARRANSARRGLCRGIGIANYIEITSGIPRERAELTVCKDNFVELIVGTMSSGQGHETSFLQLVSEWLGIPFDRIRFIANDTDRVSVGGGSHSGRSMRLVSIAIGKAVEEIIHKGKLIAAHILKTRCENITYEDGVFIASTNSRVDLWEIANAASTLNNLPTELRGNLEGVGDITNRAGGYPYGSHVCEVEVDPDTGQVSIASWTGIDDVGLAINPVILHGQAQGAVMQGVGQALLEQIQYDQNSAQLLTGSFLDYAMPRFDTMPPMKTIIMEVPASSHPYGIRPGGEGGTTPALGLLINAIVNALSHLGVKHVEMPATPERVWRAINTAKQNNLALQPVDHDKNKN